jgi:hypothetical protein
MPTTSTLRQRWGGALWTSAGSYGPYPASTELWQWAGQSGIPMDAPPEGLELVTREAVAHFYREVDIEDLRAWTNP